MSLLLDTHVLLWLLTGDPRLGSGSRGAIEAAARVLVSAASLWEVAIKAGLGRLTVPDDLREVVERSGLEALPVTSAHAWGVRHLAGLEHRDPLEGSRGPSCRGVSAPGLGLPGHGGVLSPSGRGADRL